MHENARKIVCCVHVEEPWYNKFIVRVRKCYTINVLIRTITHDLSPLTETFMHYSIFFANLGFWEGKIEWPLRRSCICDRKFALIDAISGRDFHNPRRHHLLLGRSPAEIPTLHILCPNFVCVHDVGREPDDDRRQPDAQLPDGTHHRSRNPGFDDTEWWLFPAAERPP